jgi:hypothetical protein
MRTIRIMQMADVAVEEREAAQAAEQLQHLTES